MGVLRDVHQKTRSGMILVQPPKSPRQAELGYALGANSTRIGGGLSLTDIGLHSETSRDPRSGTIADRRRVGRPKRLALHQCNCSGVIIVPPPRLPGLGWCLANIECWPERPISWSPPPSEKLLDEFPGVRMFGLRDSSGNDGPGSSRATRRDCSCNGGPTSSQAICDLLDSHGLPCKHWACPHATRFCTVHFRANAVISLQSGGGTPGYVC